MHFRVCYRYTRIFLPATIETLFKTKSKAAFTFTSNYINAYIK
jgi:hypothetical protein